MKRGFIFISVSFFIFLWGLMQTGYAQRSGEAVIEGRVVHAHTEEPLQDAHLFLAGTKMGSVTDRNGQYRIADIPVGSYRLVASIIGFQRVAVDTLIQQDSRLTINFRLQPDTVEMDEVIVEYDEEWEKDLERFTRLFIGESERADSVVIVNPHVLSFETRWWGRFTAEASRPLEIENHSLGYRVTYHLDEFRHGGTRTRWDGEPHFEEMIPADSAQAALWEENRREAFYGSIRHFLISLVQEMEREEGYAVYRYPRNYRGIDTHRRFRVPVGQLIRPHRDEGHFRFNFSGRLEIIYMNAKEGHRYTEWIMDWSRSPKSNQTSYLELNTRPLTIDSNGEILETYGATRFGYFAFYRLADLTPKEYRPWDWSK